VFGAAGAAFVVAVVATVVAVGGFSPSSSRSAHPSVALSISAGGGSASIAASSPAAPTTVPVPVTAVDGVAVGSSGSVSAAPTSPPASGPSNSGPGAGASTPPVTAPPIPAPNPEPNRAAPSGPAPTPQPGSVWSGDFPDPSVLQVGAAFYAYSTEAGLTHVQTLTSTDLTHWQYLGEALPELPPWSTGLAVWAPHVVKSATAYVMFYASKDAKTGDQCIGRAVSVVPQGPFVDSSADPFMCQVDQGGDIDPDPFVDTNGAQWLVWKSQGTLTGIPSKLWSEPVNGDWSILSGSPTAIATVSQAWEKTTVERPDMVHQGGSYYLLYSGNDWWTSSYGVGYAVCRSMTGPCQKPLDHPILASHGSQAGPGSCSTFTDLLGHLRVAYAAWTPPQVGYPGGRRSLHLAALGFLGGQPSITGG